MSFWDDLFGNGQQSGYQDAMGYYKQMPGLYNQYMSPYMNAAQGMIGPYSQQLGSLMQNPSGFINSQMGNYSQSPFAQNQIRAATAAANQAGAAGGTLGTPAQQEGVAQTVNGLASTDQYNYLDHVMGAFGQGMNGTQNMIGMGNQDAMNTANALGQNLQNEAGAAYGEDTSRANTLSHALGFTGFGLANMLNGQGKTPQLDSNGMPIPFTGADSSGVGGFGGLLKDFGFGSNGGGGAGGMGGGMSSMMSMLSMLGFL